MEITPLDLAWFGIAMLPFRKQHEIFGMPMGSTEYHPLSPHALRHPAKSKALSNQAESFESLVQII
jgi:hypothetical protein